MGKIVHEYIDQYIQNTMAAPNPFFSQLRTYAEENHIYIVKPQVERFLVTLVSALRPKKILEVGTAIGYSAMRLQESAGEDSHVVTVERDESVLCLARQNIAAYGKQNAITTVFGDASEVLNTLSGDFDFVLIDAAKGQSRLHFDACLRLVHPGSVIVTDDVLYMGMTASDDLMIKKHKTITMRLREYLNYLCSDTRFETSILPIGDGVAVTSIKEK